MAWEEVDLNPPLNIILFLDSQINAKHIRQETKTWSIPFKDKQKSLKFLSKDRSSALLTLIQRQTNSHKWVEKPNFYYFDNKGLTQMKILGNEDSRGTL